jgi:hypothetical protein
MINIVTKKLLCLLLQSGLFLSFPETSLASFSSTSQHCRCLPSNISCWNIIPWSTLNTSINGRLIAAIDPLSPCSLNTSSSSCDSVLVQSDNEFWLSDQPAGYLHTGLFGTWNISTRLPSYAVLAESAQDISEAVKFASFYNLRIVVKNTGHDWFTRSSAPGSLLIWTHLLKNISFSTYYGCNETLGIPSVTIGAGVQFNDLYPAAQEKNLTVVGGTCDSVGAAGCWLGGCYGTWSKMYGSGASNLISATVVLANGDIVVAEECSNGDLLWSLQGGGGGLAGIVVELTARTHPAPSFVVQASGGYTATDDEGWQQLLEMQFNTTNLLMSPAWGGGVGWSTNSNGGSVSFWSKGFEKTIEEGEILMESFDALVASNPNRFSGKVTWSLWNASTWIPGQGFPWMEQHPDREISTGLLASFSRYPIKTQWATPSAASSLASSIINFTRLMPTAVRGITGGIDFEKGSLGTSTEAMRRVMSTAVNPVVINASGLLLIMYNVPSLPTVPPSSGLLKRLWPRLQNYLNLASNDTLVSLCTNGANGDDVSAISCLEQWQTERAPPIQAALSIAKTTMMMTFPNVDENGNPFSGSYIHETDYEDENWSQSQWGDATYSALKAIKVKYDPNGLFICHHCVGSEEWDSEGNCRL